jgi:hypothetical protein
VELASDSMLATFGSSGAPELAEPNALVLCAAIERLLDDGPRREVTVTRGLEAMAGRTWARAAGQLEVGLGVALERSKGSAR